MLSQVFPTQSGFLSRLLHGLSTLSLMFGLTRRREGSGRSICSALICSTTTDTSIIVRVLRPLPALRRAPAPQRDRSRAVRRPALRAALMACTQ